MGIFVGDSVLMLLTAAGAVAAVPFIILAATLQFFSLLYLGTLIYAGDKLASVFRARYKISALSNGGVGLGFFAFAVKLALASAT